MFHNNLKTQRLKCGLSQKQVADFLSVSPQSVSKWEKGESLPSIDYLPRLAECFNCDINTFFEKEEEKSIDYTILGPFVALITARLADQSDNSEDIAAYVLKNPSAADIAIKVCRDLMEYKTANVKSIRRILNCADADARTFLGYLERCEMIEKLDVDDFYYVIKDAVEGFILLLKIQMEVCEIINRHN